MNPLAASPSIDFLQPSPTVASSDGLNFSPVAWSPLKRAVVGLLLAGIGGSVWLVVCRLLAPV